MCCMPDCQDTLQGSPCTTFSFATLHTAAPHAQAASTSGGNAAQPGAADPAELARYGVSDALLGHVMAGLTYSTFRYGSGAGAAQYTVRHHSW